MPAKIAPQPGVMEIALYVGGESRIEGRADVLKLSSNENPRGPSPAAVEAAAAAVARMHRYPSTDHADLRAAIGEVHGLDPDRIICGVGSDEVLQMLCHAYAGEGTEVVITAHGFAMYRIIAHMVGATPVEVPETDRRVDPDLILAAITDRTRIVFIANPGNPTGTRLSDADLARLAAGIPPTCLLVIDSAYAEFAAGYDGGASLVEAHENVVMTRTFSKLYGLGGLRVGWGYARRDVIDVLNRVRQPFNLSLPAIDGALAAVRDRAFAEACIRENAEQRARLSGGLRQLGIACDDSEANFVLARFADAAEAEAADAHLKSAGIIVRRPVSYGFPEALRITVGRPEDMTRVLEALAAFREVAA
ncbi:histidinol-phosphate transaminase [Rhodobacterales bacterium HKCCE2091]|nr:histidinol-phosphate transaminase [Rhodobacterales bacterium HKCCE2091]